MPDVLTPLDSLLAEATSLAAQLSALEGSATPASGVVQTRHSRVRSAQIVVHATSEQGRVAEIRAKVESHRTESRARMEQEIERCLGRIEALRVAVERIEAEGWTSAEPLLREVL